MFISCATPRKFHCGYTVQIKTCTQVTSVPSDKGAAPARLVNSSRRRPADCISNWSSPTTSWWRPVVNTGALALQAPSTERLAPLQIHHFVSYKWTLHLIVLWERTANQLKRFLPPALHLEKPPQWGQGQSWESEHAHYKQEHAHVA